MSITKNDKAIVMDRESLQYLANCIRLVHSLPELLNDVLPSQTTTFSSFKLTELLNTLESDLQNYVNSALGNLSHLKKEIVSTIPTDDTAEEDTIYLFQSQDGGYEQYLKINGVVTSLGSTSAINNVYTKSESDSKFALLSTLNSLVTAVGGLNDLTTTDKTSIVNAINELKTSVTNLENKSTIETSTQAEYNQKVADGTIDNDTYYIISDDSENIEITQTISSSSTDTQVPSASAIYNKSKNKITELIGGDIIAYADSTISESVTDTARMRDSINSPYGADNKSNDFYYTIYNMDDYKFKRIIAYDIRKNDMYMIMKNNGNWGTWKKVCTTSVADVPKTNITSRVSNATVNSGGGVSYSVKNGICYVQIQGIATSVASNGQRIISNSNIPNPDYELTNGHYTIVSPNATNGLVVFDGKGGIIYYGGAMTIYTTISYPVKES